MLLEYNLNNNVNKKESVWHIRFTPHFLTDITGYSAEVSSYAFLVFLMLFVCRVLLTDFNQWVFLQLSYTRTHVGFYGLRRLSIGVMVFILYKLYVLLPFTNPTAKLSPHRRLCAFLPPPQNSLYMIYKRFKLWEHWKCPHKSPYIGNTYIILIYYNDIHYRSLYKLCVIINHKNMHTHTPDWHTPVHTHTQTHTHTHRSC